MPDDFRKLFRPYEDTEASTLRPSDDIAYYKAIDEALKEEARLLCNTAECQSADTP